MAIYLHGGVNVKGAARHVVIIKAPDSQYFEEAIFVIKRDVFEKREDNPEFIMEQAKIAAENYIEKNIGIIRKRKLKLPPIVYAAAGLAATAAGWLTYSLIK